MSGLELFAAALGVIAVWLTVKQNPWCWPIGLVMVLLYSWIFFEIKLYSGMLCRYFLPCYKSMAGGSGHAQGHSMKAVSSAG